MSEWYITWNKIDPRLCVDGYVHDNQGEHAIGGINT